MHAISFPHHTGQIANRMQILGIKDLDPRDAFTALKKLRGETIGKANLEPDELIQQSADVAGKRVHALCPRGEKTNE